MYREVHCVSDSGQNRRVDLIILDRKKRIYKSKITGFILDPTVRFEIDLEQAIKVDEEKKEIFQRKVWYYELGGIWSSSWQPWGNSIIFYKNYGKIKNKRPNFDE